MPKITVIVPVYKVEPYIHKCVDSILMQSFQDFDLVLVDDGSPDTCPQICDDYASQDERITVIHKTNGGLSDARNAGIDWAMQSSNSEWLAFIDSDDYIHPDYLLTMFQIAQNEKADLVICDFIRINEEDEIIEKEHKFYDLITDEKEKLFEILCSNWRITPAWNKLYHKNIFEHLRFACGKIHEDHFAIIYVLWNCKKAVFLSEGLYYYLSREGSIMKTETPKSRLDSLEALVEQYEFGKKNCIQALESSMTIDCLNEYVSLKESFDKDETRRFKQLKRRLFRVYLSYRSNRKLKRLVGLLFPELYSKLGLRYNRKRQLKTEHKES